MKNYYQILELNPKASFKEIKTAYRQLSFDYHPEINKSSKAHERFVEINEAYHILRDPIRRARYDAFLKNLSNNQSQEKWKRKTERSAQKGKRSAEKQAYYKPKSGTTSWFLEIFGDFFLEFIFKRISNLF